VQKNVSPRAEVHPKFSASTDSELKIEGEIFSKLAMMGIKDLSFYADFKNVHLPS
jgi:hypothetical protein